MELIQQFLQSTWNDLVTYPFLQRMVIASLLVSVTCSILSVFVVLKKLAFIGQGISHSAFGGIAFGLWLFPALTAPNLWVYLITVGFCVLVAFFIAYTSRSEIISEDSAIGIFFVTSMALGVILLAQRHTYTTDVTSYLFGKVAAVSREDLFCLGGLFLLVSLCVMVFFRDLYASAFDTAFAGVIGAPTSFLHYLLLFLLSLTIVLSVKIVGIILVTAFLVIPGASALLVTIQFKRMVLVSVSIGILAALAGIAISNKSTSLPAGATMVVVQFGIFILLFILQRTRRWLAKTS